MPTPEPDSLAAALDLRVQLRRGLLVGLALAIGAFGLFVLPGARRSPLLYVALAFVVAVTGGGLVTTVLVAYRAHRLATSEEAATPE